MYRYQRVLPRDLFNESKLLKCLGQLALLVHDGQIPLKMDFIGESFDIDQRESDGGLYCSTVKFYLGDDDEDDLCLYSAYNSKSPYPLFLGTADGDEIAVFYADGNPTVEFLDFLLNPQGLKR